MGTSPSVVISPSAPCGYESKEMKRLALHELLDYVANNDKSSQAMFQKLSRCSARTFSVPYRLHNPQGEALTLRRRTSSLKLHGRNIQVVLGLPVIGKVNRKRGDVSQRSGGYFEADGPAEFAKVRSRSSTIGKSVASRIFKSPNNNAEAREKPEKTMESSAEQAGRSKANGSILPTGPASPSRTKVTPLRADDVDPITEEPDRGWIL
ncbi:hypothetical protein EYC84_011581 [Monilinia fructicola]|uniref:Uncharacterized protein n=1 Tax=Monilinia fructicola TaxID=38448 RepID=A0A5M9JAJ3_MONFR|nr:hypothetical protein EYC84_011581 [Monilinia fructicola]